ncbi:DNA cytosine methyltransferase [Collinsella sp. AGMB00827]|uniref:DNA (cytosine-5-)-methyltransferase n=1 Tax=Collinsella ureilytica TaxID=2869515 RepID=A0ABS7MJW7_9ACTN|nr:DNA cytosine methyltransferase [Collinsella urealyticum]MBY4797666.1 DNA cytosine methyltransferase [Collinsella urealyticum]
MPMDGSGNLTAVELFAGAGGLLLGTALAGFKHLVAVEREHNCCNTLRLSQAKDYPLLHPDLQIIEQDVQSIDWSSMPKNIDLLAGGPPCQPFSLGGLSRAETDKRDMFPAFTSALATLKPRAFICENVKGLTRESFHQYYEYILLRLQHPSLLQHDHETWQQHAIRLSRAHTSANHEGLRYEVIPTVVNAADYGVPQNRYRVFIVGFRSDVEAAWAFPERTHGHNLEPYVTLRTAIENVPGLNNETGGGTPRSYPGHTGSELDKPSKAIKAGVHGVPGGENMIRYPDGSLRYLTVREAARVQTFPDGYEFTGAWSEGMRQIGNAVPVELARIVASSVACALHEDTARKQLNQLLTFESEKLVRNEAPLVQSA